MKSSEIKKWMEGKYALRGVEAAKRKLGKPYKPIESSEKILVLIYLCD